jgi:Protein of unknown function (DUF2971).
MSQPNDLTQRRSVDLRKYFTARHFAYIEQVASLKYRDRCAFLRQDSVPRFLYKYRTSLQMDSPLVDRHRDLIVRSQLFLASPARFNDPYDMSVQVVLGGNASEVRKTFDDILKERGVPWQARQKELKQLMRNGIGKIDVQRTYNQMVAAAGVYSFAGDPLSILMWAHYGENHRGFCFQFDVAQDVTTFASAQRVEYSDDYPVLSWVGLNGGTEKIETVLLRKFSGWSYEKEHRIVMPASAGHYVDIRPDALTGIIIGCQAPEESVVHLNQLLAERSAANLPLPRVYRAVKHGSRYQLIMKRVTL